MKKLLLSATLMCMATSAYSQEEVINACSDFAEAALRTFESRSDDRAFLDVSYSNFCSESRSYEGLTVDQRSAFNAVYRTIARLGYGSSNAQSSVSEHYEAFCSTDYSQIQADQQTRSAVDTIYADALQTLNICLRSAELRVTASFTRPDEPDDQFSFSFQSPAGTRQITGVQGRNATCFHGETELGPESVIDISSNAVNIYCLRRSEPIDLYGLEGTRYPRTQVFIFTDYAPQAFEVIIEEGITGPLDERLELIERAIAEDTIEPGSILLTTTRCPNATYEDVSEAYAGRILVVDATVDGTETTGGGDGTHTHDATHTHSASTNHDYNGTSGRERAGGGNRNAVHINAPHSTSVAQVGLTVGDGAHTHAFVGFRMCRKLQ